MASTSEKFSGPRVTLALAISIVVLLATLVAQGWYVWVRDDAAASSARPVVIGKVAQRSAVEAASRATEQILARTFMGYDRQAEDAATLMTEEFAAEYRRTVRATKKEFVAARTRLVMNVVAAGVVRASSDQVQALLFLDQSTRRRGQADTSSEYRALVTVVRTGSGWLVSDIETR